MASLILKSGFTHKSRMETVQISTWGSHMLWSQKFNQGSQLTFTCSKSTIETLGKVVGKTTQFCQRHLNVKWVNMYRRTLRSGTIFDDWKLFKMMKNAFYFTLKVLFRSQDIYLSFCRDFLVMQKKLLD